MESKEITERHNKARSFIRRNGYSGLVMATAQNIQYFTDVNEPSCLVCGVVIITERSPAMLTVLWLDQEVARLQAKEVTVDAYTPDTQGKVIIEILESLGGTEGPVAMDLRASTVLGGAFRRTLPNTKIVNATFAIEEQMRSVKSEAEIKLIQKSCEIATAGMQAAIEAVKPGVSELEVAGIARHKMISLGSDEMKHTSSVASGYRVRLPHAFATQKRIEAGELVSIDIGAVYQGYCSDIARSLAIGQVDEGLKKAYSVLQGSEDAVLAKLRPGVTIDEIQSIPREFSKAAGYPMVGHMGHNVGLQVEEHPNLMETRAQKASGQIEAHNVLAFFQGSIKREGVLNLGLRLEDTILVTDQEPKVLTNFPRELLFIK